MENRKQSKRMDYALTLSLATTLLLLIILLPLTIVWRTKRINQINGSDPREQKTCDTCNAMTSQTDPGDCSVDQDGRCCCKTSYLIDSLVKMIADAQFGSYRLKNTASVIKSDCAPAEKASGKMIGIDTHKLNEATQDDKDVIYFKTQAINSVPHSNGGFSIQEPGLYYVFSQIKYEHDPETTNIPESLQSHTLYKYSSNTGHDVKLLEKTRSFSELNGPENNGTSFIGAVFDLEKDDQIMVQSSHAHKLIGDDKENFFGLYII